MFTVNTAMCVMTHEPVKVNWRGGDARAAASSCSSGRAQTELLLGAQRDDFGPPLIR